jgi:hypothetical protein
MTAAPPKGDAYYVQLLTEMRDCAKTDFDLQMTRIGWITSKAQIAFAVLGVGLTIVIPRVDAICKTIPGDGTGPSRLALGLLALGGLLWLAAFGVMTFVVIDPRKGYREGTVDPLDLHRQLYGASTEELLATVAVAYNSSADANRDRTDNKIVWMHWAFVLAFIGMCSVVGSGGVSGYWSLHSREIGTAPAQDDQSNSTDSALPPQDRSERPLPCELSGLRLADHGSISSKCRRVEIGPSGQPGLPTRPRFDPAATRTSRQGELE